MTEENKIEPKIRSFPKEQVISYRKMPHNSIKDAVYYLIKNKNVFHSFEDLKKEFAPLANLKHPIGSIRGHIRTNKEYLFAQGFAGTEKVIGIFDFKNKEGKTNERTT